MISTRSRAVLLILTPLVLFLTACGVNSIPTAEENAKAKWADVQNYYQRRADLIPNLVATVRAAAAQERNVLREVTEARASATRITVTPDQLTDPAAMQRYAQAQTQLTLSLQRLQEAYPELHTNENFRDLQSQLEGTENRISTARHDYNEAVQAYNTTIRTFPSVIGARVIYGSQPMVPYRADETAQHAPPVNFGNGQ
jgi:LemA protein